MKNKMAESSNILGGAFVSRLNSSKSQKKYSVRFFTLQNLLTTQTIKAFSVAEAMIALLIGSLILGYSAPMIAKQIKHNNMSDVQAQVLNRKIEELRATQANIPSGAVMYFDLPKCPDGWNPLSKTYPDAKNAFIRNIEGTNRALGSLELNAAPEIEGGFGGNTNDGSYYYGSFYYTGTGAYGSDGDVGGGYIGFKASKSSEVYGRKDSAGNSVTEVRPDNIALLACRKD